MLEKDMPFKNIAMVGCYTEDCGSGDPYFQEEYIFRNLWCSFLAISNITNQPVQLNSLKGELLNGFEFQPLVTSGIKTQEIQLPQACIHSNSTVFVPLAIILPPFYPINTERWSETYTNEACDQVVSHEGVISISFEDFIVYRNQFLIKSIIYKINNKQFEQDLYDFDLGNMYTINRSWECGSCPHLFFVGKIFTYFREVLAHCDSKIGIDRFKVPDDKYAIVIAEIEDEVTQINSLLINGKCELKNFYLKKNQFIKIPIMPGSFVEIRGQYLPSKNTRNIFLKGIGRNELICNFLNKNNKDVAEYYFQINNNFHKNFYLKDG